MEDIREVCWYTFSWLDVPRLPIPEEVRRPEVETFVYREAEVLQYWSELGSQMLGLFAWSWVWEDRRVAQWELGDWFGVFRDLRFFFYVGEPQGEGAGSVHILAVQEDGADYLRHRQDELLRRYGEVLALLEAGPGPGAPGSSP